MARLLRTPSISATHVAFAYANNIWIVERKGGDARRLSSFQGQSTNPKISPDGTMVAFSADYAGNTDVYVVPVSGGEPQRLTWHPGADTVQGWTPDGTKIMFASGRQTVGAAGGAAILDRAGERRHRGADAVAARISGKDLSRRPPHRLSHEHLVGRGAPQLSRRPESAGVDRRPEDRSISSRRRGPIRRMSIRRGSATRCISFPIATASPTCGPYDTTTKALTQRTKFIDYDVKSLDAGGGAVVFEQAGYLHVFDPKANKTEQLTINAAGDFPWMMTRFEDVTARMSNVSLSPTGKRVLVEARGEIFTIPEAKGDVRNITNSSGSAERQPAWSPDGKWISYFSDKSGEYKLVIESQDGVGAPREISLVPSAQSAPSVPRSRRSTTRRCGRRIRRSCSTPTPTSTCG